MAEDNDAAVVFENGDRLIRRQWHDGRWFFSVVDVIGVLTDSANPRNYWNMLKRRLADEGAQETYTNCVQLKMRSLDGKMRATDAADTETLLRIIQSVPSPKAEPVKQWLARVGTERLEEIAEQDVLAGLTDDQRRLFIRAQLTEHNKSLADAAQQAGVLTKRDFAVFTDSGYRGLYNGETARDITARKQLRPGQNILDYMGHEELAANLFRATQTEAKLRREGITDKDAANRAHHDVGQAVRRFIVEELGGTPPEQLPTPPDSIEQVRQREQKRVESERQPLLLDND